MSLTVNFFNDSGRDASAMLFLRTGPDRGQLGRASVAWIAKYAFARTRIALTWALQPCFVWTNTGQLVPGVVTTTGQVFDADPFSTNLITFTYRQDVGAFTFLDQREGQPAGTLVVRTDAAVPPLMASVGVGLSEQAAFLMPAVPNMQMVFDMRGISYWIAFGSFKPGQVLEEDQVANAARIDFPPNIVAMDARIDAADAWHIAPTHLGAAREGEGAS